MVSIIIAYKHDSPERLENLKFVANRYREHQVIVVEQETDTLNHVSGFYYMRVNGPWSRPKCFNEGAKIAYHDRLVFMDCDVFFEDNITGIVNAAPCVMPRRRYLWLNETQSKQIKNGQQLSGQITYFIDGGPWDGCISLTQKAYRYVGGWPEEFVGWGGSSYAMGLICTRLLDCRINNSELYHLHHPRGETIGSESHRHNCRRLSKLNAMSTSKLLDYCHGNATAT
jgi:hypothetical protein